MMPLKPTVATSIDTGSDVSIADEGSVYTGQENIEDIIPLPEPLDSQKAYFFQLPLNVRKEIYRYSVVPGRVFVRPFVSFHYINDLRRHEGHRPPNMAMFMVCRKSYEEVCPLFYTENTFSILHPDVLLNASNEHPRLRDHLKHMHNIEVVFHHRDFQYLSGPFCNDLLAGSIALKRNDKQKGKETEKMAKNLLKNRACILGARTYIAGDGGFGRTTGPILPHAQDIKSMQDYFFGRTLTFLRQRLLISKLELKFMECNCPEGCCRLAGEILNWGTRKTWTFDLPRSISVTGATEEERKQILDTIAHQRPSPEVVDLLLKSHQNRRKSFTNRSFRGMLKAMELSKK
ncbi:hypothetical protein FQN49_003971 [Arthroderma sp. PD_2]|nr:hypothetical protein FQN49_003971 [Arthroderma sp. PD_2]